MSEIQETISQSVQSSVIKVKIEGTPLAEYIKSLFEPLRETIEDIDWMENQDEFNPRVYRDAVCLQISAVDKSLCAIGDALNKAVDWEVNYDSNSLDFTFHSIDDVSLYSGWDRVGGIFENNHYMLNGAGDLLSLCKDIKELDWGSISHMLHLCLEATEKYHLDACRKVTEGLGEVIVFEKSSKKGKKTLRIEAERAEELIKAARGIAKERAKRRRNKEKIEKEIAAAPSCGGCPVLDHMLTHHKEAMEGIWLIYEMKSDQKPKWMLISNNKGKDLDGGCFRVILEKSEYPQLAGIDIPQCPKLANGTGCELSMAAAGQEV